MLLNLGTATQKKVTHSVAGSAAIAALLALLVTYFLKRSEPTAITGNITSEVIAKVGHTELIGKALFVDFLLPFEITSVLLLVAIIGAVVLAKREV
jgi:NADH-quinone oxidoreductase subunit J